MTDKIMEFIKEKYSVEPEYLWATTPTNAALRNPHNGKWFAVLLGAMQKSKLGIATDEKVDVLNLKCDPMLTFSFVDNERVFRGYHMNKEHWISVLLDSSVSFEELRMLVDMSYELVDR